MVVENVGKSSETDALNLENVCQMYENSPFTVMVYEVAEDDRIILNDMSLAAESFKLAVKTEDIGKYLEDIFPPDLVEWTNKALSACIETGEKIIVGKQIFGVSGQSHRADGVVIPIKGMKGNVTKIISVLSNVTDIKIKELERLACLKYLESIDRTNRAIQSASNYESLFIGAGDGICLFSIEGRVVCANDSFAKMLGHKPIELVGVSIAEITIPETDRLFQEYRSRLPNNESLTFEAEGRHKDGHIIHFEISASIIKIEDGSYIQAFTREITDCEKTGKALQDTNDELEEHRAHLKSLVEERTKELRLALDSSEKLMFLVPVAIFSVDSKYRILSWNRMMEEITGYEKNEVFGKKYGFLFADPAIKKSFLYSEKAFDPAIGKEYMIRTKKGRSRLISANVDHLRDLNNNIVGGMWTFEDITDRKQLEKRFIMGDIALERACEGIEVLDENGRFIYVNTETCRSLGYTREEILRMGVPDVDSYWNTERWPEIWSAVRERKLMTFEAEHRRKDGTVFPIEVVASPFVYDGEDYLVAFTRDITERKQTEKHLKMMEVALENVGEGVEIMTEDGKFVFVNTESIRTSGYTREELLKMGVPSIDPYWYAASQGPLAVEAEHVKKDGTIFPVEIAGTSFTYDSCDYIVAFIRDITKRKEEEEIARKREESLAEAMHIAQMADWEVDLETQEYIFNDRFYGLLRTTAEKEGGYRMLVERYLKKFLLSGDAARISKIIMPTNPKKIRDEVEYEHVIKRGDGSQGFVNVKVRMIRDEKLNPIKVMGTTQDITERKIAEEELKKAREDADKANQAKSMFLANMSHELRTPLNAILGFTQLMNRDESIPEEPRKNLSIINRSGEHLLSMINDVLDLSKIEAGRTELREETFDLIEIIEDIGEMLRSRARAKGLEVVIDLDSNLRRFVNADLGKIRQILINLLGNAVKFTDSGGVALRARMNKIDKTEEIRSEETRMLLEVEVQDTGLGIPKEKLNTIFTPFTQVGSIKASQMGTGLGLTISQSFAALMKGDIVIESEEGKGSVFRFKVPVSLDAEITVSDRKAEPSLPEGIESGEPEWRILVVEDHIENALLVESILGRVGLKVRKAGNGKEGIEIADAWRPHLILMDLRMPVMDGFDATKAIRKTPWGKELKIIAFTASVFSDQKENVLAIGCDDILHKPFRDWQVFDILVKHLGIRFKYPTGMTEIKSFKEKVKEVDDLSPSDIEGISKEIITAIKKAAIELNKTAVLAIAKDLEKESAVVAAFLKKKAEMFDFESIERVFADENES